jgi:hypothetical protein
MSRTLRSTNEPSGMYRITRMGGKVAASTSAAAICSGAVPMARGSAPCASWLARCPTMTARSNLDMGRVCTKSGTTSVPSVQPATSHCGRSQLSAVMVTPGLAWIVQDRKIQSKAQEDLLTASATHHVHYKHSVVTCVDSEAGHRTWTVTAPTPSQMVNAAIDPTGTVYLYFSGYPVRLLQGTVGVRPVAVTLPAPMPQFEALVAAHGNKLLFRGVRKGLKMAVYEARIVDNVLYVTWVNCFLTSEFVCWYAPNGDIMISGSTGNSIRFSLTLSGRYSATVSDRQELPGKPAYWLADNHTCIVADNNKVFLRTHRGEYVCIVSNFLFAPMTIRAVHNHYLVAQNGNNTIHVFRIYTLRSVWLLACVVSE